jgi:hypothetical protein
MNRLELAQQLRRDCGISGNETTTINASGEWGDVVNWVDRAWRDIQLRHPDWLWMRRSFSFATVAQQSEYAPGSAPLSLADFASWVPNSFRIYKDSIANETRLNHWFSYENFRNRYLIGSLRTSYSQPTEIVISPNRSLILALPPNDASYTVSGDYQKIPTVMTLDTDTPDMPERFHMAIIYRAMFFAGVKESAGELIEAGNLEYRRLLDRLELDQLPPITTNRSFL